MREQHALASLHLLIVSKLICLANTPPGGFTISLA
jgi:hypothetical protein